MAILKTLIMLILKILLKSWFKTGKYKTIFPIFRKLKLYKKPIFKQKSEQKMQFLLKRNFERRRFGRILEGIAFSQNKQKIHK